MNRTYHPENSYIVRSEGFPHPLAQEERPLSRAAETVLSFFDLVIGILTSSAVRSTLRILSAAVCFFAFLFVIGAVEAGTLTFGGGVLTSFLLCAVAFLSVFGPKPSGR